MGERIKVEGYVTKITSKSGQNARGQWTAYSVRLQKADGTFDDRWYQWGFEAPKFKSDEMTNGNGDYVSFEAEVRDEKVAQFIQGTGKLVKNPPARQKGTKARQDSGGYSGKKGGGGYSQRPPVESTLFGKIGQNSTEDDIRRISYTSARTAAIQVVELLLANDALPISGAKTKAGEAQRFDEVTAAIDKLTVEYFYDAAGGRKLATVADNFKVAEANGELPTAEPTEDDEPGVDNEPQQDDQDGPPADDESF